MSAPEASRENSTPNPEPLFRTIKEDDPAFDAAYDQALATLPHFIKYLAKRRNDAHYAVKMRFRDPDESERRGRNVYLFLWLTNAEYHADSHEFSATFFEVPKELLKWHHRGQRIQFNGEDNIFDWMALTEDGRLFGGYTLRVTRSKLPENKRADYDRYIGVKVFEALE